MTEPAKPVVSGTPTKEQAVGGQKQEAPAPQGNAKSVLGRLQSILAEYDNQESRIPLTNEYWELNNQYRTLLSSEEGR